jgi:hypothetical protein
MENWRHDTRRNDIQQSNTQHNNNVAYCILCYNAQYHVFIDKLNAVLTEYCASTVMLSAMVMSDLRVNVMILDAKFLLLSLY